MKVVLDSKIVEMDGSFIKMDISEYIVMKIRAVDKESMDRIYEDIINGKYIKVYVNDELVYSGRFNTKNVSYVEYYGDDDRYYEIKTYWRKK